MSSIFFKKKINPYFRKSMSSFFKIHSRMPKTNLLMLVIGVLTIDVELKMLSLLWSLKSTKTLLILMLISHSYLILISFGGKRTLIVVSHITLM
jgi:hypothetical protein